jgi:hypothetical protein
MAKFTFGKLSLFKDKRIWALLIISIFAFAMWFFMKMLGLYEGFEEGAEDGPDGVVPSAEPTSAASADGKPEDPPKESSCENKPKKE